MYVCNSGDYRKAEARVSQVQGQPYQFGTCETLSQILKGWECGLVAPGFKPQLLQGKE